jgi:DNA-binding NarL/FixJ family response regulator
MVKSRETLRVALVDADENAHQAIRTQFSGEDQGWSLDVYSNAAQALERIPTALPKVVLMDVSVSGMCGVECTRKLKMQMPDLPVVMFTTRADAGTLLNAVMTGANGYLIRPLAMADLTTHLNKAVAGGMIFCLQSERLLLEGLQRLGRGNVVWRLTRREREIMGHLERRSSDKEIASALGIAQATVHAHLARMFKKLEVHDREAAVCKFYSRSSMGD